MFEPFLGRQLHMVLFTNYEKNSKVVKCRGPHVITQSILLHVFQNHSPMHLFIQQGPTKFTSKLKQKTDLLIQQIHCLEITP